MQKPPGFKIDFEITDKVLQFHQLMNITWHSLTIEKTVPKF